MKNLGAETFTNLAQFFEYLHEKNAGNENSESIILMCVSNPVAIQEIYEKYELLKFFNQQTDHLIDMSTVDVATVKFESQKVTNFLEAPVSGSKPQANSGTLVIMAAGKQATFQAQEKLKLFEILGKKTFYYGETVGNAAKMKLCVNQFMGNVMTSLAESLKLAGSVAGDTHRENFQQDLVDVLLEGALNSPIVKAKAPNMINSKFEANFPMEHQTKDLRLAVELGESVGVKLPMTSQSLGIFKEAAQKFGESEKPVDMCGVYRAYE